MKTKITLGILGLFAVGYSYFYLTSHLEKIPNFDVKHLNMIAIILSAIITTYILTKVVDIIFIKTTSKFIKTDSVGKKLVPLIHNLVMIFIWIFSIFTTLNLIGFNLNTLLTGAGIGGVLLALAGKEAASNLFGSLSLIFSKSFKIGDLIRVKGLEGNVEEITLSYTKLIDKKGNIIYMPNKNIVTETIENLTQGKHKKFDINLPLPLDLESAIQEKLLTSIEKFLDDKKKKGEFPSYKIVFDNVTATSQVYNILIEISSGLDIIKTKKETYLEIKKILEKSKINFPKQA